LTLVAIVAANTYPRTSEPVAQNSATPPVHATETATVPVPASAPPTSTFPERATPDPDAFADALVKRLSPLQKPPVVTGPMPPFSLGGGWERDDMLDFVGPQSQNRWRALRKAQDPVEIDWTVFEHVDLILDATLRGGPCELAVIDAENEIPVARSGMLAAPPLGKIDWQAKVWPQPPSSELKRIRVPIPHQTGKRRYRLGILPPPRGGSTLWAKAAITFPSYSFGSEEGELFEPKAAPLRGRVPHSVDIMVDWDAVRDPINTVVASFTLTVSTLKSGNISQGRAMLIDRTENSVVAETNWLNVRGPSMHKWDYPASESPRIQLPRKKGRHVYGIDVEVTDTETRASVVGSIIYGH
jgi:hypothetical protein